jgi:hypothetical protein
LGFDDDIVFCQTAWPNGRTVCKAQVIRLWECEWGGTPKLPGW